VGLLPNAYIHWALAMVRSVNAPLTAPSVWFTKIIHNSLVAWVPLKLAERSIAEGVLTDMRDSLPSATLHLAALRMKGPATERKEAVWQALIKHNLN